MNSPKTFHEDREISCKFLAQKIATCDEPLKKFLLQDFLFKSKNLRSEARNYYTSLVLLQYVPDWIKLLTDEPEMSKLTPKPIADIAIITVKKVELLAAKIALGIDPEKLEDKNDKGFRYFETRLLCRGAKHDLKIVLTMVGRDRNVPCTNACRTLFNNYDVGVCFLIGIAAGLRGKFNLGDVVAAELVWDYEGARLETDGPKKRPEVSNLARQIGRDLQYFDPDTSNWLKFFSDKFMELKSVTRTPDVDDSWHPSYHTGVILTGEKLLADGTLNEMREDSHERVRALEMEASGFSQACDECDIPWLILRGISDFGDSDSKNGAESDERERNIWQATAALSAATAAINFIENEYRLVEISVR